MCFPYNRLTGLLTMDFGASTLLIGRILIILGRIVFFSPTRAINEGKARFIMSILIIK
jgi:hypothetical protein